MKATERGDPGEAPAGDDPRLGGECVRTVAGTDGTVTLVGVVHEHPASVHRAAAVVRGRNPDVLALELPPLALSLYVEYAADEREPPVYGGEMSAAVQAADTDRIVGIDGPSLGFLGRLSRRLLSDRPGGDAVRGVLRGLRSATREAVACCVAGVVASRTSLAVAVGRPVDHDCTRHDDPARQASDEQRQIRRARAVMDAVEPSRAAQFRDEVREAHMADRLETLRPEGDVVAVVGYGHLSSIVEHLRDSPGE